MASKKCGAGEDRKRSFGLRAVVRVVSPLMWALGAALLGYPAGADAFEIQTGFTEACHESISVDGASTTIIGADDGLAIDEEVPLPDSERWDKIAELLIGEVDADYQNDRQKFALVSLVLGSRYPDSGGTAVVNLSSSRQMHAYSDSQRGHCLRSKDHDGPEGNEPALQSTREYIRQTLDQALSYRDRPAHEQVVTQKTHVEFYGEVDIEVWAPAFYAGYALHTFQDCFSHTIRTDDLTKVLHVLNYTEAITEDHQPARDGLAHSHAMDRCEDEAAELAEVAQAASVELLAGFAAAYHSGDTEAIDEVLQDWTSYEPGCTVADDICDSKWLTIAEQSRSAPLVDTPSCSSVGGGRTGGTIWMWWSVAVALWLNRRD